MNLFDFEYTEQRITNLDGSPSRFGVVYGQGGNVIHTKKDSYHIIPTEDISLLGNAFIDRGYSTKTFTHRQGEVIGLNISLGDRPTKLGDKTYNAIITIPNNGGGKGYLSIKELRLVCLNGMSRTLSGINTAIKIPHTVDYNWGIQTMERAIQSFTELLDKIEEQDLKMDERVLSRPDVIYRLNEWFFNQEMPDSHKEGMKFNDFRQKLYEAPDTIKSIDRYRQLMTCLDKEAGYNEELNLNYSMYTVYATVTNYLSRRIEASKSSAPIEVQYQRAAAKVEEIFA